jgi:hypothetical protein
VLHALQMLGLTPLALAQLVGWAAAGEAVTLRFAAEMRCDFAREEKREVEQPNKVTTESTSAMGSLLGAKTTKVVTTASARPPARPPRAAAALPRRDPPL